MSIWKLRGATFGGWLEADIQVGPRGYGHDPTAVDVTVAFYGAGQNPSGALSAQEAIALGLALVQAGHAALEAIAERDGKRAT